LPNPELLKFDGHPTCFSLFMANFEAHVESRLNPTDDVAKLFIWSIIQIWITSTTLQR